MKSKARLTLFVLLAAYCFLGGTYIANAQCNTWYTLTTGNNHVELNFNEKTCVVVQLTCADDPAHPQGACGVYSAEITFIDSLHCDSIEEPIYCQKVFEPGQYKFYLDACDGSIATIFLCPESECESGKYPPCL